MTGLEDTIVGIISRMAPGSLPGWGMFATMGAWIVKTHFDNRKLRMVESKDDREGFGVLITALQADVVSVRAEMALLRKELATSRADHRICEERLNATEAQLRGVHQQILAGQRSFARLPETNTSPAIDSMMDQLDRVEGKPE